MRNFFNSLKRLLCIMVLVGTVIIASSYQIEEEEFSKENASPLPNSEIDGLVKEMKKFNPYEKTDISDNLEKINKTSNLRTYRSLLLSKAAADTQMYVSKGTFSGHKDFIYAVERLNDDLVASGSGDNSIIVWSISQNTEVYRLLDHKDDVFALLKMTDNYLLSASGDKTIKLWSLSDRKCVQTFEKHTDMVISLVKIDDDKFTSGSMDKTVKVWSIKKGLLYTLEGHSDWVMSLMKMNDNTIISGSGNKDSIKIWSLIYKSCIGTLSGHSNYVSSLVKINDDTFASGSLDSTIQIWSFSNKSIQKTLTGHSYYIYSLIKMSEDTLISGSADNTIKVWSIKEWYCLATIEGHYDWIRGLSKISENSFASASDDKTIKIWTKDSTPTPTPGKWNLMKTINITNNAFSMLKLNDDNIIINTSSSTVELLSISTLKSINLSKDINVSTNIVKMNDDIVICGTSNNSIYNIQIFSIQKQSQIDAIKDLKDFPNSLEKVDDDTIAFGFKDGSVNVWSISKKIALYTLKEHTADIRAIKKIGNDRLITSAYDNSIKIWSLKEKNVIYTSILNNVAYSLAVFNENLIICGMIDGTVILFNVTERVVHLTFKAHSGHVSSVTKIDNDLFASASSKDKFINIFSVSNKKLVETITGHTDGLTSVITLNDYSIASSAYDQTIKIWYYKN